MKLEPLVSVVIPTYNRENLIKRSILSVLNGDYKNIEVIVVDDHSTDNTYQIVSALQKKKTVGFNILNLIREVVLKLRGIEELLKPRESL
jgi:glycosyltransferase involved in cell wall biosynthesis